MTRFMMTLDDAVDLVLYAFQNGTPGDIFVQKAPSATIEVLSKALKELMGKESHPVKNIGTRHGEKLHETLLSREEMAFAEDLGQYFRVPPDLRDLNYGKYIDVGDDNIIFNDEYSSDKAFPLDVEGLKELLLKLKVMQSAIQGDLIDSEG